MKHRTRYLFLAGGILLGLALYSVSAACPRQNGSFVFREVGAAKNDPGLTFSGGS